MRVVDHVLWLGFWWVKYLPFPGQGGNVEVELHQKSEDGSTGIVGTVVTTTLASAIAEAIKTAATDLGASATDQVGKEPKSVASPSHVEL